MIVKSFMLFCTFCPPFFPPFFMIFELIIFVPVQKEQKV